MSDKETEEKKDAVAEEAKAEEKPAAEEAKAEEKPAAEEAKAEEKPAAKEAKADEKPAAKEAKAAAKVSSPKHGEHAHGHDAAHAHGHHAPDRAEYWRVFFALLVLTILEVGVAYLEKQVGKTALVTCLVSMALVKAGIVAMFFMHLKHETKVMRWTVVIPMMFPALYAFILIAEGIYRSIWGS